jgi:hypothetical protein
MIENKSFAEQINSFLSGLKTAYSQQGPLGKILFPGIVLLVFCFLCSVLIGLFPLTARDSATAVTSPNVLPSVGIVATPTPLFDFGLGTFTPFPTFPAPSPLPSLTSLPTGTETPTQAVPTETATPLPTVTNPPPTAASSGSIVIVTVNKTMEYVDLQNVGNGPVDLSGWRLVSVTGNQSCPLRGVIGPNEMLRVWSGKGDSGLSCEFAFNIWNDNQADPALLIDAQAKEVSRYP